VIVRQIRLLAAAISIAAVVSAGAVLYANCGACGPAKSASAAPAKCADCAALQKGRLCGHCTSHKLGLSEEDGKKLAPSIETYNKTVDKAQEELLSAAAKQLGEEKATQLAASLQKPCKAAGGYCSLKAQSTCGSAK